MSKWKGTNKYGIHESKAAYWRYTRQGTRKPKSSRNSNPIRQRMWT